MLRTLKFLCVKVIMLKLKQFNKTGARTKAKQERRQQ